MASEQFDTIVIGAGQGGGPIASAFATSGRKTALIEREFAGGTCVNWGCTPTKTMIASGRIAHLANRSTDYGIRTGDVSVDMPAVRQRVRDIVTTFRDGSRKQVDQTDGLEFLEGEASFTGDKRIKVIMNEGGVRELHADTIVLDVGERARELKIENPDRIHLHDNRSILEIDEVPLHLVVVGGGPIALEFAQLFRRLGAEVTILNRGERILSKEDDDIARAVHDILIEDGIRIKLNTEPTGVQRDGEEIVIALTNEGKATERLRATHVLNATGRIPNTDVLDAEKTGLELDERGYVPTNVRLETNQSGIYAIGDIRPGPKFTHISYDDYRILKANLIDGGDRSIADRIVAATTYIDPQLGRVGATEAELQKQGTPYMVASMPMESVARALETDETRGLMKILVHAKNERILGAAVLGIEGGEIASMLQIAMMGGLPYTALRDGVFAHPTLAESLNNAFGNLQEPGT